MSLQFLESLVFFRKLLKTFLVIRLFPIALTEFARFLDLKCFQRFSENRHHYQPWTNLIHFIDMRRVSVELYEDRDLFAAASPRHDTLGSERRVERHRLSAEVTVKHLAAADRRRSMNVVVQRGWSPVVVAATGRWWRCNVDNYRLLTFSVLAEQ